MFRKTSPELKSSNRIIDRTPETAEIRPSVFMLPSVLVLARDSSIKLRVGGREEYVKFDDSKNRESRKPSTFKELNHIFFLSALPPVPCIGIYCPLVTKPENPSL